MHEAGVSDADVLWLARTFSRRGLHALFVLRRRISQDDLVRLRLMAVEDLSRTRAYVSKTRLPIADAAWMMKNNIGCGDTVAWTLRLPFEHCATNLVEVLRCAVMVHRVPEEDLCGWVKYANLFEVRYEGERNRRRSWAFLGGSTALLVQAGVGPEEAAGMTRSGDVDPATLRMLAGLRTPTGGR